LKFSFVLYYNEWRQSVEGKKCLDFLFNEINHKFDIKNEQKFTQHKLSQNEMIPPNNQKRAAITAALSLRKNFYLNKSIG